MVTHNKCYERHIGERFGTPGLRGLAAEELVPVGGGKDGACKDEDAEEDRGRGGDGALQHEAKDDGSC